MMKFTAWRMGVLCLLWTGVCMAPLTLQAQVKTEEKVVRWDDTHKTDWDADLKVVDIPSKADTHPQKAYLYKAPQEKRPLIVSLHTWSGDYRQYDPIAAEAKAKGYNYIHPDFQGANTKPSAMGSQQVIVNLQEAIEYAVRETYADANEVHVIGVSGGGMATLIAYMNVTCPVKSFSAWAPISDLESWYWETKARGLKYADHVWKASYSKETFNAAEARKRSPLYQKIPRKQRRTSRLYLYTGVHDGYKGSVPVTHSLNMYNRVVGEWKYGLSIPEDANRRAFVHADMVSEDEMVRLLSACSFPGSPPSRKIDGRQVWMEREAAGVKLVVFEGAHEMLPCALDLVPVGK